MGCRWFLDQHLKLFRVEFKSESGSNNIKYKQSESRYRNQRLIKCNGQNLSILLYKAYLSKVLKTISKAQGTTVLRL